MDVTPQELRSSEIKDSWRGYDRDEVDDLLERAAVTIESLTQEVQESQRRPAPAPAPVAATIAAAPAEVPLPSSRDDAEMLQRTLLLAQRAADDAVNEAQARAKQMLEESEAKAQTLVSDAEATARRIAEGERRRLEAELLDLSARREQLRSDADALEQYVAGYRDRIRSAIEGDLAKLGGDVEPPSERPELHDVEIPVEREPAPTAPVAAIAPSEPGPAPAPAADVDLTSEPEPEAAAPGGDDAWDSGSATHAIGGLAGGGDGSASPSPFASEASATRSPVAAPPRPEPAEWPPAPVADAAPAPTAAPAGDSWLSASSDSEWASSTTAWDAPAPWERENTPAAAAPTPAEAFASDVPMEANAIDTDSLDDDAFFASLREAVRDDAPLGPRDDEQAAFFDSSTEQDRRRFRRRR
ncbi:MAG TPA: DivIVA domain-containing protein [Acidimicrobiia bacterium]|jgi:DivIVA domain-containing protein